jgi:hypothetical protein
MGGKVFLCLVCGVGGMLLATTRLAGGSLDWLTGIWLMIGVASCAERLTA